MVLLLVLIEAYISGKNKNPLEGNVNALVAPQGSLNQFHLLHSPLKTL